MKTSSWGRRATTDRGGRAPAAVGLVLAALGAACGHPAPSAPPGVSVGAVAPIADFDFESLDDRPVNARASRGKPLVMTFVTTSSLPSQAQVDFLVAMSKNDGDRVNYAVVALEARDSRELVELYAKSLSISFPVALADERTRSGAGAFGDLSAVPVTILLDRGGRLVWRVDGRVAKSAEIRAAMRGL